MSSFITTPKSLEQATQSVAPNSRLVWKGRIENWAPWGAGAAAAVVLLWWAPDSTAIYNTLKACVGSAIDAAAILAGFQGSALSLLLALMGTESIQALRRQKLFGRLVSYNGQAIFSLILVVGVAMVVQGIQGVKTGFDAEGRWIAAAMSFVVVAAVFAGVRVTRLMMRILVADAASDA